MSLTSQLSSYLKTKNCIFPNLFMLTSVNTRGSIEQMARPRHPNKTIEKAVAYAETVGWRVEISSGHAWGRLYCSERSREGCKVSIWSTPRNPENHARHIRREVDMCPHFEDVSEQITENPEDTDDE